MDGADMFWATREVKGKVGGVWCCFGGSLLLFFYENIGEMCFAVCLPRVQQVSNDTLERDISSLFQMCTGLGARWSHTNRTSHTVICTHKSRAGNFPSTVSNFPYYYWLVVSI